MTNMNGLPGIEVLFRENKRLANKLTKDELKSLKTYISDRLLHDHEELLFEYNTLKSSHNSSIQELKLTIEQQEKELAFKNEIIKNYKSSDENLAIVYKKRGEKLEKRHSVLLEDHESNKGTVKLFELRVQNLQKELEEYQQKEEQQAKLIEEQEEAIKRLHESQDNVINSDKLAKDLLKVKLAVDDKTREFQKIKQLNAELLGQIEAYKSKCTELQTNMEKIKTDFNNQTQEFRSKCEQIASLQYHIDMEKRTTSELQKELQALLGPLNNIQGQQGQQGDQNNKDVSMYKAESMRSQVQYLEGRVKLVEERLALYRISVRDSTKEVGIVSTDCKRLEQLIERLVVHESTTIEKTLIELRESTETRRCVLEESIDEILKQAPGVISRDANEIRAQITSLKKQAEQSRLNDVIIRCSRLFPRIEACEKAQFAINDKVISKQWKESTAQPKYTPKPRRSIDHTNTTFSGLPKKPPPMPLLLRSKTHNGNSPVWKRKYSTSMDSILLSPTLIDLSVSPNPSPRATTETKSRVSFFPPGRPLSAFSNSSLGKTSQ
ncbi:myosin-6-like [Mytilus trossulus]|uniref:myosin-6-like n=1 Tax=Mytilus trossulus TaxID=6551 RepID=UPI0030069A00